MLKEVKFPKKRFLALVAVMVLSLMLAACGGSTEAESEAPHELEAYKGKPLTETMQKIDELGYTATYLADGVDFTDFIDDLKEDYSTGDMVIDEDAKTVEVDLVLASNVELEEQEAALEEKLEIGSAWAAVEDYGNDEYGGEFDLNYLTGNIEQSAEDENTWYLKATCEIKKDEKTCEAKVTGTTDNPEVIFFDVY